MGMTLAWLAENHSGKFMRRVCATDPAWMPPDSCVIVDVLSLDGRSLEEV